MLQVPIKDDKSTPAEVILPEAEDNSKELQHEEPMKKYSVLWSKINPN